MLMGDLNNNKINCLYAQAHPTLVCKITAISYSNHVKETLLVKVIGIIEENTVT